MLAFIPLAILALASRAVAFNVTLNKKIVQANEILGFEFNVAPMTDCNANCTIAKNLITACNNDSVCLCKNETAKPLVTCQQCMYTSLIAANKPMPDARAGSNPLLAAYVASCAEANQTLVAKEIGLTVPAFWDSNFGQFLPFPVAVLTAAVGGFLGISAILILSNM